MYITEEFEDSLSRELNRLAGFYCRVPTTVVCHHDSTLKSGMCSTVRNGRGTIYIDMSSAHELKMQEHELKFFYKGILMHETGHINYSDFTFLRYGPEEAETKRKEIMDYLDSVAENADAQIENRKLVEMLTDFRIASIKNDILNALEDAAIENTMNRAFPKMFPYLHYTRKTVSEKMIMNMHESRERRKSRDVIDTCITELLLLATYSYNRTSCYGHIIYLPEHTAVWDELKNTVLKARLISRNTEERYYAAVKILDLLCPVVKKQVKKDYFSMKERCEDEHHKNSDVICRLKRELEQYTECAKNSVCCNMNTDELEAMSHQEGTYETNDPEMYSDDSLTGSPDEMDTSYCMSGSQADETVREELLRQKRISQQRKEMSDVKKIRNIRNIRNNGRKNLKNISEEDAGSSGNSPNQIRTISVTNERPGKYGRKAMSQLDEIISRSNRDSRKIKREIQRKKMNHTKKNLDYGNILASDRLYRCTTDGRIFMKRKRGETPHLKVSLLIDASTSMKNDFRIVESMKAAYYLSRMLQILNIPFSVSAHQFVSDRTLYFDLISFKKCFKKKVLDSIFTLEPANRTNECDALEHALKILASHLKPREKGLVFVITDAETDSKERIRRLCSLYSRTCDIDVIALGVGTLSELEETYENQIYVRETDDLCDKITEQLKKLIL